MCELHLGQGCSVDILEQQAHPAAQGGAEAIHIHHHTAVELAGHLAAAVGVNRVEEITGECRQS